MDNQSQSFPTRIASAITNVVDSLENPISNPGTTEDTVLTLSGIGAADSVVFIIDNGVLLTSASVTINGTWRLIETFALGLHEFTVRDEPEGVDSPPWVVTIQSVAVKPTILNVVDSTAEVVHEGTTFDTTVLVGGSAAAGETVEFFHNRVSRGSVLVGGNSLWTHLVTGMSLSRHDFQVEARYGNNPVSNIRSLTVLASTIPTISSIKDADGVEIPPNTATLSTTVTLTGTGAAGQQIEIYDGAIRKGIVPATNGTWVLTLNGLAVKSYSFRARGLYGNNPESEERAMTVREFRSGFEDFESAVPGLVPGNPINLPSGLQVYANKPGSLAITRVGSQQGEHGFQHLSVSFAETGQDIPHFTFPGSPGRIIKTVTFAVWLSSGTPGRFSVMDFEGAHLDFTVNNEKQWVTFTSPSRMSGFSVLHYSSSSSRGVMALDSIRWSE